MRSPRYPGIADSLDLVIVVIVTLSVLPLVVHYLRQLARARRT